MKNIKHYIRVAFFLLAVLFIGPAGFITDFGWRLNLLLGIIFFAISLLSYFPIYAESNFKIQLILHNILSIIILIICPLLLRLPVLALSIFIFYIILNRKKQNYYELVILGISTFVFFLYLIIYNYSPNLWYFVQSSSEALSRVSSSIIQNPINSNPTFTGLHISIYFIICSLSIIWFIKAKRLSLLFLSLIYIAIMTLLYVILQFYFSRWIMQVYHAFYVHSLHARVFLIILLSPLIFFLLSKIKSEEFIKLKGKINRQTLNKTPVFIIIFLSIFILTLKPFKETENKNILFYDKGYLDWRLPDHKVYGAKNGGMFGLLPTYLEANNFSVKHDSLISHENLSDNNILVIINLLQKFNKEEKQLIWDFVENGGSLFVMGDHTGFKQIREPINNLLTPFDIELNFDCAIPFTESWRNSMYYYPHPITSSVSSNYESNIFIGASLSIGAQARPLITGMFGYSDPGNINASNNGYLGDMRYTQGEQLGDQVLVAESFYGKGKVLVFGDTSPFQNSALVQSHTFVIKVFNWLSTPLAWWHKNSILISISLLLIGFLSILFLKINIYDYIIIALIVCVAALINLTSFNTKNDINYYKPANKKLALINASNLERFSLDQWNGSGYGGLCYNLMRAGYMPLINTSGVSENLIDCELLVLIAPAKPFNHSEIIILDNYVRNGGVILITSGWEESYGTHKLLENFALSIENVPLGKINPNQNKKKLTFTKAWGLSSLDKVVIAVCEVWNQPTIIYKPIEKGGIILIGDSGFLLNDNLEGMESYNRQNILFFKEMIEKYATKR